MSEMRAETSETEPDARRESLRPVRLTVIRPDSRFSDGPIKALRHLAREILAHWSHIRMIFRQDFQRRYRGTVLGVFWNFVLPLLPISVYILLAQLRVVPMFEGMSNTVSVSMGATLWFLFAGCVQQPISVVRSRNAEIMKTALPLSAAVVSSFGALLFDLMVRLGLVLVVVAVTLTLPAASAPLAVPVLLVAMAAFVGLGLVLAILNIVFPDVERVVTVFLQYGIFLSGVIFPLSSLGPLAFIADVNPFAIFIAAIRELVFLGGIADPLPLMVAVTACLQVLVASLRMFYVMEYRIRSVQ